MDNISKTYQIEKTEKKISKKLYSLNFQKVSIFKINTKERILLSPPFSFYKNENKDYPANCLITSIISAPIC